MTSHIMMSSRREFGAKRLRPVADEDFKGRSRGRGRYASGWSFEKGRGWRRSGRGRSRGK